MMADRLITLEQRKQIQLEMLSEIDTFCRTHGIRYMIAFGTLLGAVRHKGYIPWDDDVDISMPIDDMLRFKNEFKSDFFGMLIGLLAKPFMRRIYEKIRI